MKFDGEFKIKPTEVMLKERGLQDMGPVQRHIDETCIDHMAPYTPFKSGVLEKSATINTKIGSGTIKQDTPYARNMYYGVLMVDPITGKGAFYDPNYGFWSRPDVKKVPSGRELKYNASVHPLAGKMWFERMKADRKEDILKGARKVAGAE